MYVWEKKNGGREREERKGCTLEAEKNCNKTVSAMKTCLNWP